MMTTQKRRRFHFNLVVVAAVGMLVTACGPPGARQLRQGEQYIQAGQFAEAIGVLREATRILVDAPRPDQAKAWNLVGLACHDLGQFDAADNAYRQALKLGRDNAATDYNLGCLRIQQSNFPGAIDYLTTYIALRPKDVQGYLRLATAHFHYAMEQRPGPERSRFLEAARRDLELADGVSPSADAVNALGVLQMQRRLPGAQAIRAAAANFELALRRDPHCAPALLNLAIVSQQYLNNPGHALQLYRVYLTLSPPPPHAIEVAKLVHDLDVSQRIIITPETAPAPRPAPPSTRVKVAPFNPVATTPRPLPEVSPPVQESEAASAPAPPPARAPAPPPQPPPRVFAAVSAPPSAVQAPPETSPTVNTTPSVPEPVVTETAPPPRTPLAQRLNPLHWFSGKSKTDEQASAAEPPPVPPGTRFEYPPSVTPIPGDRAQAQRLLAEAIRARQAREFTQSIRAYQDAIAADPTFYEASFQLGLAAIESRDYPTALEALHRALALQEDSADARYAFAWTLQKRGYTEDAVHELEKLLGQHPEDVRAHLLLGNLYAEKLRQPKLAREQYIQALALDPANAQAANIRAWLQQKP
jgi:tetratricopeptide (TPR) repeat protein